MTIKDSPIRRLHDSKAQLVLLRWTSLTCPPAGIHHHSYDANPLNGTPLFSVADQLIGVAFGAVPVNVESIM